MKKNIKQNINRNPITIVIVIAKDHLSQDDSGDFRFGDNHNGIAKDHLS